VLDSLGPSGTGEVLDSLAPSGAREAGPSPTLIVPTPSGRPFNQQTARRLADRDHLIFACGRYEGIDARVVDYAATRMQVLELSIGDYVLAGGEVAALVIIEAVVRLLPGVLGNPESLTEESYSAGQEWLLEYPTYTKPPSWRGLEVPAILFSGNHAKIAAWRREQALARTRDRRPDLRPSDGD
jgi:tRNA (guanine37-N1)-methyltransferase